MPMHDVVENFLTSLYYTFRPSPPHIGSALLLRNMTCIVGPVGGGGGGGWGGRGGGHVLNT